MSVTRGKYVYSGFVLEPAMDLRVDAVCAKFQLPKSQIIRRCVDLALPHFERSARLPALRTEPQQEKAEK